MDDYGVALEPLQQLIKELTPDGAWLFGPEGKALAKLPSPGFAWQGGEPVAISTARVGPLRELCAAKTNTRPVDLHALWTHRVATLGRAARASR